MKKFLAVAMTGIMMLGTLKINAYANEELQAQVYVTISDEKGKLALAQEKITVTDIDNDGVLTINDAFYAAHEAKYEGGAKEGYASSQGQYGIQLDKLWGTANGGSYGYCINNQSAMSLNDVIKEGDYINAYVFTDLTAWSDTYCYFEANTIETEAGKEVELKLSASGYDASWNPITIPVEGAVITVNGEKTEYTTDKDGKVTILVAAEGSYVISAVSDTMTLVPPVCKATVIMNPEPETTSSEVETTTTQEAETTTQVSDEKTPDTGDNSNVVMLMVLFVISLAGAIIVSVRGKKNYE